MIADILVHVDATGAGQSRLSYAFDLAEQHHAHLSATHVLAPVDVPPLYKPRAVQHVASVLESQLAAGAKASEKLFWQVAKKRRVTATWHAREGRMAHQIADLARSADLIILGNMRQRAQRSEIPFH